MVTISDKHFGQLLGKAAALELAMEFAENQAEVIQKQEEASKAGMKRIKELEEKIEMLRRNQDFLVEVNKEISIRSMNRAREVDTMRGELALTKACEKRLIDELAAVRAELEQSKANFRSSVNNTEYWMKSSDAANKNFQAALETAEFWKAKVKTAKTALE